MTQFKRALTLISCLIVFPILASANQNVKEWTFLVFLNGNNNLDPFGKLNINQMEEVGSTADINLVVQWASLANRETRRLYITKDNDTKNVTSPVLERPASVDMGDWHSVVDFGRWGAEHFPAKHYFLTIWDHGSGWHFKTASADMHINDISWDDNTGNSITTEQLGSLMSEVNQVLGQKLDVYASDACLMAMPEVANEMSAFVDVFAGSEETEPGAGWPYQTFLGRWAAIPFSSPSHVATILTEEYVKSYTGGVNGRQDVTFSAFNLNQMEQFNQAVSDFGKGLMGLNADDRKKVLQVSKNTERFTYGDYADLTDFMNELERAKLSAAPKEASSNLSRVMQDFVITHKASPNFSKTGGVSIWLPTSKYQYDTYASRYKGLQVHQNTGWGDVIGSLLQ